MKDTVKVGIIGLGGMGQLHFSCYQKTPGAQVVAVWDFDEKKRRGEWGGGGTNLGDANPEKPDFSNITSYDNVEGLLSHDLDIVDICLPTPQHPEITIAALQAGKNVLCEKPMALTVEECQRMEDAQKASGKQLLIGHCLRYWPHYVKAKEIIESGKYGKVLWARFHRSSGTPKWSWNNWFQKDELSGGALLDMHIHDADIALHWFGKPDGIYADGLVREDGLHVTVDALWNYDNGPKVYLHGGWDDNGGDFRHMFKVVMERGTILMEGLTNTFKIITEDGEENLEVSGEMGHLFEIQDLVDCVANGRELTRITPAESRLAVETVREEMRQIDEKNK